MFQPGGSSLPSSSVELSLRCERLRDLDTFSKSDPFCVVECKTQGIQNEWMEIGRTECVMDNLNPVWQKKVVIDYNFEQRQMLGSVSTTSILTALAQNWRVRTFLAWPSAALARWFPNRVGEEIHLKPTSNI